MSERSYSDDLARRERKKAYIDLQANPGETEYSASNQDAKLSGIFRIFTRPSFAWSVGLALGLTAGVFGTSIAAVTDVELISKPLWWAIHIVDWVS